MKVFISYSKANLDIARKIAKVLQGFNIEYWMDTQIKTGESIIEQINKEMNNSTHIIIVLSKESVDSQWVQKEIQIVMNHLGKIKPIILRLNDSRIPPSLRSRLYYNVTPNNIDETIRKIIHENSNDYQIQLEIYKSKLLEGFKSGRGHLSTNANTNPDLLMKVMPLRFMREGQEEVNYDILNYLTDKVVSGKKSPTLITGGAGAGKTTLCSILLQNLAKNDNIFPFYTEVVEPEQESNRDYDLYSIFIEINKRAGLKLEPEFINKLPKEIKLVLIIDNFDQFSFKNQNLLLTQIIEPPKELSNIVIVLTSRSEINIQKNLGISSSYMEILHILGLDAVQIESYFKTLDYNRIPNSLDLNQFIIGNLPDKRITSSPLDLFYQIQDPLQLDPDYEMRWIKNMIKNSLSELKDGLNETLPQNDEKLMHSVLETFENLAWMQYTRNAPVRIDDLASLFDASLIRSFFKKRKIVTSFPWLVKDSTSRDNGEMTIEFTSKEWLEYFFATKIMHNLREGNIKTIIESVKEIHDSNIFEFIRKLANSDWLINHRIFEGGYLDAFHIKPNNLDSKIDNSYILLRALDTIRSRWLSYNSSNIIQILSITNKLKRNMNLNSLNLEYLELSFKMLEGANLSRCNMKYANLKGAILNGCNLERANLYGCNLANANLERANLYGCNLANANLERANLYGCNLANANLEGANINRGNLANANLEGANLRFTNLRYIDGRNALIQGIILEDANFFGAELEGSKVGEIVSLRGINLKEVRASKTTESNWSDNFLKEYHRQNQIQDSKG